MSPKTKTAALAAVTVGAVFLAIALLSGVLYEQVERNRDRERFPQIGRSVDIGGRILNIYCSGSGSPAVVFESGATWPFYAPRAMFENGAPRPGYAWVAIQRELAGDTTACWYDRAGSGWSDPGPYPRDSASQARDLHALLLTAGVPPPYVLVAEFSASSDARVYTGFYPDDVAGMVLVNGVDPDFSISARPDGGRLAHSLPAFIGQPQDAVAHLFNDLGFFRLGLPKRPAPAPPPRKMTSSEWNTIWHLTQSGKARSALLEDIASWQQSTSQARTAGTLGRRPLIVLSSENTALPPEYRSLWVERQTGLTRLSARAKQVIVSESNGELVYQAPGAVIEAARQVLANVRRNPVEDR